MKRQRAGRKAMLMENKTERGWRVMGGRRPRLRTEELGQMGRNGEARVYHGWPGCGMMKRTKRHN